MKRMSVVLAACLMAGTALASDREALIAQIEAGGQNEFEDERHAVTVTDCQLTTYRWKKVEGEGWVLWSSFELPMLTVDLVENTTTPEVDHYVPIMDETPWVVILFEAKDGTVLTHEKPFHRTPKGAFSPSSRGDGTTHFIETKTSGMIVQKGPDVIEKARMFTTGYIRYVQEYCAFIG